jgi:cyclic beta-1,2-glucan synthetase
MAGGAKGRDAYAVHSAEDEPLRAELLSPDRLADEARGIAATQRWIVDERQRTTPLLPLMDRAATALAADNQELARTVRDSAAASPAAEWLLDNYYLIEEQVLLVSEDLPSDYATELPRTTGGSFDGFPRLYEALQSLVAHTDSRIDEEYLVRFIDAYQDVSALTIGEVWAVPIMLRISMVENLRRLSRSAVESLRAERAADSWAQRLVLAAQDDPAGLPILIRELDSSSAGVAESFFVRLAQRLTGLEVGAEPVNTWLSSALSARGISLEEAAVRDQQRQAANQVSIANSITSVRFLDAIEWREFFERVSLVETTLGRDPVRVYAAMDFVSRDRYRHTLEQLSRRCTITEVELAERVLELSQAALNQDPSDAVRGHVGWWLIGEGRYDLERSIGYDARGKERFYRGPLSRRGLFYGGLLGTLMALLLALLAVYALAAGASPWATALLVLLGVIPLSEIAVAVVNRISTMVFPPRLLPKLDYHHPLDEAHRTLVVVPALLSSVHAARSVVENLEVAYLANRDANVGFGLLGDLKTAAEVDTAQDGAIIEAAVRAVSELNERYAVEHGARPFHLLIRSRTFNEFEGVWMGWERKRGALVELVRELRAEGDTTFSTKLGDTEYRRSSAFVITLDADTILPRDTARKLVCTIAHPLNRARFTNGDLIVSQGYGLVQPRVGMTLPGSRRSRFAHLYSGVTGVDPYASAVSDTYQDVFDEGSFTGKGIFEIDVFHSVLEGKFPENSLLSHDLIEGSFLRTALGSDIEVLDDYPANYLAASSRLHRWVRGDWQTLPYLFGYFETADGRRERNPLTGLHRWKIVDNLRRSLVAPSTVVMFTLGWLLIPGSALSWQVALLLLVFFPAYFSLAGSMVFRPRSLSFSATAPAILRDFTLDFQRGLLSLAVLPHQAWMMVDAATRALWRRYVSGMHLLEWETAADAERRAGTSPAAFWRAISPSAIVAVVLLALGTALHPGRALAALPLAALWLLAPLGAWEVSRPIPVPQPDPLTAEQVRSLRRISRKTWRFFESFVVASGNHLAPDNYQEDPGGFVAWRTSPTNIGLQLLAYLGAHDLGYENLRGVNDRVTRTLSTMAGLERFRGHFYNWYDIRTLEPLRPAYVSTVDSGNLAGHLLVLRIGLLELTEGPLLGNQLLDGILDTVHLALEDLMSHSERLGPAEALRRLHEALDGLDRTLSIADRPTDVAEWSALLARLEHLSAEAMSVLGEIAEPDLAETAAGESVPAAAPGEPPLPSTPCERLRASVGDVERAVSGARNMLDELVPWAARVGEAPPEAYETDALRPILSHVPSLAGLAEGLAGALAALDALAERDGATGGWARELAEEIRAGRPACMELLARMRLNAEIAREMWEHTDFKMLYDPHRALFSIGYNLAEGRLDASYYDLLASECRLASFLAVAKGDVDQEHWFRLGRSLTETSHGRALVSWSASMFEYLMPKLVMCDWPDTLLAETYVTVVRRQMAYGAERGVPWGVSESAFNAKDAQLAYQYQAFGVPGLGLKRGLSQEVVVAPYAAVLCLPIDPPAVVENLTAFAAEGGEGHFGFYEALDYTPGRVPAGERRAVVKAYFTHHQGMSFVALANALDHGRMPARFHADPLVNATELLLQERVPAHVQLVAPHVEEVREIRSVRELPPPVTRAYPTADTPVPATHFLSNGRYSVMVTNGGGGYSRCAGVAITRYREDLTRDCWGTFFYVRDVESGETFSAPYNPRPGKPDEYRVTFAPDKAEYRRLDGELETRVEVTVSPEDDVEVRRLAFTNHGKDSRKLEVTSYFEIALTDQGADQAHKSFSNLFVQTEAVPSSKAVLFTRRPRKHDERRTWGFHLAACEQEPCPWSYETDRAAFVGRLHGTADPAALATNGALGNTAGAVLDPCCAIRRVIEVPEAQTVRVLFATGLASSRDLAVRLTEKYSDVRSAQRAIDLAWTASQLELRDLGIKPAEAIVLERLASRLVLTDPHSQLKIKTAVENGLPLSGLWSIGISGDPPILLVRVEEIEHAPLVRHALLAHQYWRHKGLVSDLVILNNRPTGYADELDDRLRLLVRTGHALQMLDKPGGVYLRRADQMHPDVLNLLLSVARATLDGDRGSIELQLNRRGGRHERPVGLVTVREPESYPEAPFTRPQLLYDNGFGGFDPDTGEYVVVLEGQDATPAPWIDVLANPTFGCTVSEAGIGCTWALNSHENRITTWNNDAVSDGSGENFFIRDEETGEFWSPTPLPVRTAEPYVIRHGRGEVVFEHETHGIAHTLHWFVSPEEPIRICRLKLENRSGRPRKLSATQLVEWVLGDSRSRAQQLVVTWFDAENEILTAHNHYNFDFPGRCAFVACSRPLHSWTASRTEFVGRNGSMAYPAAMRRAGLGGVSGRYHDNCGALMVVLDLEADESVEVSFLLGQTDDLEGTRELVARYRRAEDVERARREACAFWSRLLGTVQVKTPNERLDLLVNGQLLYQATACRLWGRTATYQSSGAFGFRDQLQDVMALLIARPDLVREQIIEASRHQFPEGDVLHWWQPYSGRGVRTHITDDRHWLPLVVAEYVETTGDASVLDERTAYLEGTPLPLEQEDAYLQPRASEMAESVYEHCIRALETGRPTGAHGLPLMGGGDWNDGMNRVGHLGRGESVWLAWFLGHILMRFAPLCEMRGEPERAADYRRWAESLAEAVEEHAWDGAWYRRAYFDDGTPLGTRDAQECRIDAIAQAWATISGLGDASRAKIALDSVEEKLVRREDGLIALLSPPFDAMPHDPGYIKGYVPGVRENGGQYTHAALWTVLAYLIRGDGDEAAALLDLINPINHSLDRASAERYKVEPYVVAADVYAVEPHVGRGGWTWYTGSASWFYRVVVQSMLGLSVRSVNDEARLTVDPCIPKDWGGFEMAYRHGSTTYHVRVENPRGVNRGVAHVELDGERLDDISVPLADDGMEHEVVVTLIGG